MTPDGRFARPAGAPVLPRVIAIAVIVAVLAGAAAVASLLLSLALALLPIVAGAAAVAYGAFRWRVWRARRGSGCGDRDLFRPNPHASASRV